MALNNISTEVAGDGSDPVATKLLRRNDKLALAATERQAVGTPGYRPLNHIVGTHQAYVAGTLTNVSGTDASVIGHPWSEGSFSSPYTVRQWLGTYDPGGSNSNLLVLPADYPYASQIPVGASVTVNGTPTTVSNVATGIPAYGQTVVQINFSGGTPGGQIGSGATLTFTW